MPVKTSHGFAETLGRVIGSTVGFFVSGDHSVLRWVKRAVSACLVLFMVNYLGRAMAEVVVTLMVLAFVIWAIARNGSSSESTDSEIYEPSEENDDSPLASNDPYAQNDLNHPLLRESDFNWRDKE